MNIEKKQKKDYAAPEMIEVELVHMTNLLQDSEPPECGDGCPFQ
jgi:hypothetical protein